VPRQHEPLKDILVDQAQTSFGLLRRIRPIFDEDSRLRDIPKTWLDVIEPKIRRDEERFGKYWIWQGSVDKEGHPVINTPHPLIRERGKRRAARLVAGLFFDMNGPYQVEVTHACGNDTCLNPAHLKIYLSHHNQRHEGPNDLEINPMEIGTVNPGFDDRRNRFDVLIRQYQKEHGKD
jgi:hypothetical protein